MQFDFNDSDIDLFSAALVALHEKINSLAIKTNFQVKLAKTPPPEKPPEKEAVKEPDAKVP